MSLSAVAWYDKALNDMDMVRRALEPDPAPNLDGAAYHIHQAAEKLLKGYLVQNGLRVPRTHDIGTLAAAIPDTDPFKQDAVALDAVTPWATLWRYPPDDPDTNPPPEPGDLQVWRRRVESMMAAMMSIPSATERAPG